MKTLLAIFALPVVFSAYGSVFAAGGGQGTEVPDFTQGAKIPDDAEHDWNLGATGLRGWIYCDRMVTSDARQIAITKVDKGSPADGSIEVGDVILPMVTITRGSRPTRITESVEWLPCYST
jgi:hypothetical protein